MASRDAGGNGGGPAGGGPARLADTRARIAARVVGRERELELILAAVAAGRDMREGGFLYIEEFNRAPTRSR